MAEADYYELLGVDRGADDATIKAAYRRLAMECHPDRHGGCTDKEAHFKAISEAYDVPQGPAEARRLRPLRPCRVPERRRRRQIRSAAAAASKASPTFSRRSSASSWTRAAQRQNAARGADLRYDLELTLEEAFAGADKTIPIEALATCDSCAGKGSQGRGTGGALQTCGGAGKVRAQQGFFVVERGCPTCLGSGEMIADPCRACDGEGRALKRRKLNVDIPAGVDEGTRIRVAGEGEAGVRGAASGDLYLFVHMKRHALFQREGTNLVADARSASPPPRLAGRSPFRGSTARGSRSRFPAGIQSGETLRQRGAGMSVLNNRGRGDLVARILVETPTKLSSEQKAIPRAVSRHRNGRRMPGEQGLLRADQG